MLVPHLIPLQSQVKKDDLENVYLISSGGSCSTRAFRKKKESRLVF